MNKRRNLLQRFSLWLFKKTNAEFFFPVKDDSYKSIVFQHETNEVSIAENNLCPSRFCEYIFNEHERQFRTEIHRKIDRLIDDNMEIESGKDYVKWKFKIYCKEK